MRKVLTWAVIVMITVTNWGCPKGEKDPIEPSGKCDITKLMSKENDLLAAFNDVVGNQTLTLSQCNQFKKDHQDITYDILECEAEGYASLKASIKNINEQVQKYDCALFTGGGNNSGGKGTGEIVFRNITRTRVSATIGSRNVTLTPATGGINGYVGDPFAAVYSIKDTPGKSITLQNARTVGLGGEVVYWQDQTYVYPQAGKTTYVDFNVPSQYFLLILTSTNPADPLPSGDLIVNYGLTSQTNERWTLNTNLPQYFGYYKAFTNSKVRFVTSRGTKEWGNLDLRFTVNQVVSLRH